MPWESAWHLISVILIKGGVGSRKAFSLACLLLVAFIASLPVTDHLSASKFPRELRLAYEQIHLTQLSRVPLLDSLENVLNDDTDEDKT